MLDVPYKPHEAMIERVLHLHAHKEESSGHPRYFSIQVWLWVKDGPNQMSRRGDGFAWVICIGCGLTPTDLEPVDWLNDDHCPRLPNA